MATGTTIDRAQQFRRNAETWDAAWVGRDFERMLSIYTDDVRWEDPFVPRPLQGKAELRAYFEAMLRAFPDIEIRQEQLFSAIDGDGDLFATRWRLRGTFRGAYELPGIAGARMAPTGDRVDFTGMVAINVADDGRARLVRQYADEITFQRQIGAMPPEGSMGERIMMRLQAMGARRRMRRNSR